MVSRTTYLNMTPSSVKPIVYISQYDVDTDCLLFYMYFGSDVFKIPEGSTVFIKGAKPDNTAYSYTCKFEGNIVTASIKEQMSNVKGDCLCEISIRDTENNIVGSANFTIRVEESPYYSVSRSKTDIEDLQQQINAGVTEATRRAETAASNANASALNAKASEETAQKICDELPDIAKAAAEDAKKEAESWAVGGTGTRTGEDMDNSKYYAQLAAQKAEAAENTAKLVKDYSTIVMPDLYLDIESGKLYEKTGVGIEVKLEDAKLYWKIT